MINFYQWNRTFKTIIDNFAPQGRRTSDSRVDLKCEDLTVEGRRMSQVKMGKRKKMVQKQRVSERRIAVEGEGGIEEEEKANIFRNVAIKQKFKSLSVERTESLLKAAFKQEKPNAKECEISVHKYLSKKLKEGMEKSQQKQITKTDLSLYCDPAKTTRSVSRRYRTISEADRGELSSFLRSVSGDALFATDAKFKRVRGGEREEGQKKQSNLITNNSSLLSQILKKQRHEHENSLKVVSIARAESSKTTPKFQQQEEEPTLPPKDFSSRPFFSQKRERKSLLSSKNHAISSTKWTRHPKRSTLCTI